MSFARPLGVATSASPGEAEQRRCLLEQAPVARSSSLPAPRLLIVTGNVDNSVHLDLGWWFVEASQGQRHHVLRPRNHRLRNGHKDEE